MSIRSNGSYIGPRPTGPSTTAASGIWDLRTVYRERAAGNWPGQPITDPDFASVSLLLHMDGSNGSTTFADSSSNALTVTANGNAQISTAQSKFGGASALFDGSGDSLSTSTGALLQFGTGDFTVEAWVYITSAGSYHGLIDGRSSASFSNYTFGIYNLSGTLRLDHVNAGGAGTRLTGTSTSVALNTWTHVAWTRSSGVIACFVNGTKDATTVSYSSSLNPNTTDILIGAVVDPQYFYGYIDDFRVTKGVARYTANFTPPTAPFPDA